MKKRLLSSALAFLAGVLSVSGYISAEEYMPDIPWPGGGCELIPGDINTDGKFDSRDVLLFKSYLFGYQTDCMYDLADMNFDGILNIADLCLMENQLIECMTEYHTVTLVSPDGEYKIILDTTTTFDGHTDVTVTWYDPDGDKEKTDSFEVSGGNPFYQETETDDPLYQLSWNEKTLGIKYIDDHAWKEINFDYPDRTRTSQTLKQDIKNTAAPEVASVEVTALTYGDISRKVSVKNSGNVMSRDTVGRIGTPVEINTDNSIETYSVVIHYDENELRWVPEKNLIVIEYNPSVPQFSTFKPVSDAELDTEKNTVSFTGKNGCEYILADAYQFSSSKYKDLAYKINAEDITKYASDWEREGNTGDILKLADREWAKNNNEKESISVSTPEELASAVYYINALHSLPNFVDNYKKNFSIELTSDIDLEGYDWKPIISLSNKTVNGNGHTIRNMTITDNELTDIGFIGTASNCTVKDITFENAVITSKRPVLNVGIAAGSGEIPGKSTFTNVKTSGTINLYDVLKNINYGSIAGGFAENTLNDCSSEVMVNNKIYLFLNNTPEKMPVISDASGKITDEIKSMLWADLKDRYQNYDIDFSDFTFVYEPEHRLSEQFNGYVFSVYYKGMLIHGYGNLNTDSNVYAAVVKDKNDLKSVYMNLMLDPNTLAAFDFDVDATCLSADEIKTLYTNTKEPEKIIYVSGTMDKSKAVLAYRAEFTNEDGEYIIDAFTGEMIEYIPYFVV